MSLPAAFAGEALGAIGYAAKRLILTDREAQPLLFLDRLNDLDVAIGDYERLAGRIVTDIPEPDRAHAYMTDPNDSGSQLLVCQVPECIARKVVGT